MNGAVMGEKKLATFSLIVVVLNALPADVPPFPTTASFTVNRNYKLAHKKMKSENSFGKIVGWCVLILFILIILFGSVGTVAAGQIGVKTRFSQVVGEVQPGLYFKVPFIEGVSKMDVQTQKVSQDADAASNDLQDVKTTIAVNYNLAPGQVSTIYQTVGTDYQDVVIDPAIQETVKAATANYTAEQLVTEREKVRADIVNALTSKLGAQGIVVSQVAITDFSFSSQFNQAIEAKVTAAQDALAAQNKLQQVQFEAEQTVATAKAQAEAIQIQAAAINSEGGADYVQLQAIKQWDGKLPTQFVPGSTLPFLNLVK